MVLNVLLALLSAAGDQDTYLSDLWDERDEIRRNACSSLAEKGILAGIRPLINRLGVERKPLVRDALVSALVRLTKEETFGDDPVRWEQWWDDEGKKMFPPVTALLGAEQEGLRKDLDDYKTRVANFRDETRVLSIVVAVIAIAFVMVMIYFVGHVSSKLKEWKELVRQAGVYIEESNQVSKRTDRVLEELEAKKIEIMEFVKKIKEEEEAEIERYADLLQRNTDHKMREEMMELRQKAEKELQETLGQLRQQIELELRRNASQQKDQLDVEFHAQRDRFLKEVESHTAFLEGMFHHAGGKAEEALRIFRRITAEKPDSQPAWEKMGNALRDLERYDEAIEAYEQAIKLSPEDRSAYYNMAATYARQKKREKMLETLTLAIRNDGEFKDEALNDQAFRDYWKDPAFKDLAEA